MSEMTRDDLLGVVRAMWEERDPMPEGLVERMQAVLATEDVDLEYELMMLVERSTELVGTRGGTAYTLQFRHEDLSLLVRAAVGEDSGQARLDGWLAPATAMRVRATLVDTATLPTNGVHQTEPQEWEVEVDDRGRFEFRALPSGLFRLWLMPHEDLPRPFGTPAFEI
jgi:hypothetical protein